MESATAPSRGSLYNPVEPIIDEEIQLPPGWLVVEHLDLAAALAALADEHVGRRLAFQANEVALANSRLDGRCGADRIALAAPVCTQDGAGELWSVGADDGETAGATATTDSGRPPQPASATRRYTALTRPILIAVSPAYGPVRPSERASSAAR